MFKDYKAFGIKLSKNGLLERWADIIHRIAESDEYQKWRDDPNSSIFVNQYQKVGFPPGSVTVMDEEVGDAPDSFK